MIEIKEGASDCETYCYECYYSRIEEFGNYKCEKRCCDHRPYNKLCRQHFTEHIASN